MTAGRPSDYTPEKAAAICARMAEGESVRSICRDDDMPALGTVFRWLQSHKEFQEQYALARDSRADAMFEEMLDIADDGTNDFVEKAVKGGTIVMADHEHINRSRLRVDTRKFMLARMAPKKYSERTIMSGPDDGPIKIETSDAELARGIAYLLTQHGKKPDAE